MIQHIDLIQEVETPLNTKVTSDFIVYVDETGDEGLRVIDDRYPYYAINLCILRKSVYPEFCKKLKQLKIKFFNSDVIILHEVELNKKLRLGKGYKYNNSRSQQLLSQIEESDFKKFIACLHNIIEETEFTIISAVVDKRKLSLNLNYRKLQKGQLFEATIKKGFCSLVDFLSEHQQNKRIVNLILEQSGVTELRAVKAAVSDVLLQKDTQIRFEFDACPKQSNLEGLQLADLTAQGAPKYLMKNRQTEDRSVATVLSKMWKDIDGKPDGKGLVVIEYV